MRAAARDLTPAPFSHLRVAALHSHLCRFVSGVTAQSVPTYTGSPEGKDLRCDLIHIDAGTGPNTCLPFPKDRGSALGVWRDMLVYESRITEPPPCRPHTRRGMAGSRPLQGHVAQPNAVAHGRLWLCVIRRLVVRRCQQSSRAGAIDRGNSKCLDVDLSEIPIHTLTVKHTGRG